MDLEQRTAATPDTSELLKLLKPGDVFHFACLNMTEALIENAVYMVIVGGKDSRVDLVNLKDGLRITRDDSHRVCKLNVSMVLS